jgi:hypothetical protein
MLKKLMAVIGLLAGSSILLVAGTDLPAWLLKIECMAVALSALAYGYTAFSPSLPWLKHDSVRGVAMIYAGCAAMFIPLNFLVSAFLLGAGIRMVTRSAITPITARFTGNPVTRQGGDIVVLRESGEIARG